MTFMFGPLSTGHPLNARDRDSDLADHLWQIASETFGSMPITGQAANACRTFIEHGAPKVKDKAAAERDVRKLANEMVKDANFSEVTGSKQIDFASFNLAKSSICPLFPFC
jgi:hypothetical protein